MCFEAICLFATVRAMATAGQKIVFQLDGNAQIHKSFIIMASVFMFSKALEKLLVRMMLPLLNGLWYQEVR